MTESNGLAFAAIITISLPDSNEATELKVTLWPSNTIIQPKGSVKALQDCTLGELLQFADNLENEIWSTFHESNLLDLVIEGGAEIDFEIKRGAVEEQESEEFWLEHLIIIEPVKSDASRLDGSANDEVSQLVLDSGDEQDVPVEKPPEKPPNENNDEVIERSPTEQEEEFDSETATKDLAAEPKATELEIDIAPSDKLVEERVEAEISEEEREASEELAETPLTEAETKEIVDEATKEDSIAETTPTAVEKRPKIRILGRRRPLNHPTWTSVDILVNEPAFRNTQAHALSSLDKEVAGVLVGPPPEKQPDGRYLVHVSDTIIAKHTRMYGASVTYTPESWRYINDKLVELYPDNQAVIIGWYHTHPGFGIFLSGMDQFIHQNFFTQSWHIALVLDPLARRTGFFCWDREQSKVDRYEFPWPIWAKNSW